MSEEEKKLEELLKQGLVSLHEKEKNSHKTEKGVYYPSALGSCLRKQYYTYTLGERVSPEELVIFATGKGVHETIARAFGEVATIEKEEENISLEISPAIKLKGRIDLLIADYDGKKYLIEAKSTSKTPDTPFEEHVLQLQVYMHALNYEEGFILYWNKVTGEIKVFKVQKNEEVLKNVFERVKKLDYYVSKNVPPEPEAILKGRFWECEKCPFLELCIR
ncbi:MAG: Dna2/Cas4 domain-containing protein [Thaumarchaeota archaeon]|jgi:CRISPR/Cas system-associated exonuclease Cas4 (RecB family)|nr:Dna2/Cas4 domain-containing protein [Nitrososphaerota archaeon]